MKLHIPSIGDRIELTKPWTFTVWSESRNEKLGDALDMLVPIADGESKWFRNWKGVKDWIDVKPAGPCTFPKGTILTLDRIYIRKGKEEYDSVSFRIFFCPDKRFHKKAIRFWATLEDVNNIYFEKPVDNPTKKT
jgi:hypothetical protein